MTTFLRYLFAGMILWLAAVGGSQAASVRSAVWAGPFYPENPDALRAVITGLLQQAAGGAPPAGPPFAGAPVRALVLPHAGYRYSGLSAAHGILALPGGGIDTVVVLGPDHRVGFSGAAVSDVDAYATPLGSIPLHPGARRLLIEQADLFQYSPASDRMEHSIEVVLPFLQHRLGSFQLVPVVVGTVSPSRLAARIDPLLGERTLLVVSSDLSHFLSTDQAVVKDAQTLDLIRRGDAVSLMGGANRACGACPLAVLLTIARDRGWQPAILHYSNSGDTAGDRERVVGYAAVVFYGGSIMDEQRGSATGRLGPEAGQALVALARQTIAQKLKVPVDEAAAGRLARQMADPVFAAPKGTFVTLKMDGDLRGCIGTLTARQPLRDDVMINAINAAFRDPRFPPLTATELARVVIEVSVLSDPVPLSYDSAEDLKRRLRPGVDGVILGRGSRRATFLPQVWEQLPTHDAFLGHLCRKAGLPEKAWRDADLEVSTYQVTYFEEPHGAP